MPTSERELDRRGEADREFREHRAVVDDARPEVAAQELAEIRHVLDVEGLVQPEVLP
jgi:hypothetical protein